jgi:uncharacterized protein (DUF1919 family)
MILARKIRTALARAISQQLLPKSFCIISDDCWGGQLYRQLRLQYATPTAGLWIEPKEYLDFLNNMLQRKKHSLEFLPSDKGYPLATCLGSTLHFMHYSSEEEARDKFTRRFDRINWNRILVKIDFGKPGYTTEDIERWNNIRLANSIAFYSSATHLPNSGVFNGILIPDWVIDGAAMFDITRKYFNIFAWVKSGNVSNGIGYKILNNPLFDPTAPGRMADKVKNSTSTRAAASRK